MGVDPNGNISVDIGIQAGLMLIGGVAAYEDMTITMIQGGPDFSTSKGRLNAGISIVSGIASFCGPLGSAFSAGLSVGQVIGDVFDEQITNGLANLIYNIKYKKKQQKQGANLKPIQQDLREVDPEALNWMLTSSDPYAQALKDRWYNIGEMDSWSLNKKYEVRVQLIKVARTKMPR